MLEALKSKLMAMVGRCILTAAADDSKGLQKLQVKRWGQVLDVERMQQYGFTSVPKKDAEAIIVALNGDTDNSVVIALDDRKLRLKDLGAGEVAIYDDKNQFIKLTANGLEIETVGDLVANVSGNVTVTASKAVIDAPSVELAQGALEAVLNGQTFQTYFNTHTHSVAGITSTPPLTPSDPSHLSTQVKAGK